MRVLFDQGTTVPLRRLLTGHEVATAFEMGWSAMKNGELLAAAEAAAFQVLLTTDTHLKDEQNLRGRAIAVVALTTTSWPRIRSSAPQIAGAIEAATPGSHTEVRVP